MAHDGLKAFTSGVAVDAHQFETRRNGQPGMADVGCGRECRGAAGGANAQGGQFGGGIGGCQEWRHGRGGAFAQEPRRRKPYFYNRLTDETGGRASYELEFPNGGLAFVVGNHIQQGSQTENPTLISFGAEGYKWPRNELYLVSNTLADDRPGGGKWLAVRTDPGAKPVNLVVKALNNVLVGTGELGAAITPPQVAGNGDAAGTKPFVMDIRNNINVDWDVFVQASRQDYRLANPAKPPPP